MAEITGDMYAVYADGGVLCIEFLVFYNNQIFIVCLHSHRSFVHGVVQRDVGAWFLPGWIRNDRCEMTLLVLVPCSFRLDFRFLSCLVLAISVLIVALVM